MKTKIKNLSGFRTFCIVSPTVVLSVISGLLLTASFPKVNQAWLAWIAFTPLLFAIRSASVKESFRLGFIAGFVHYTTLMYWVIHAMSVYGKLPLIVCIPALCLLASYLALFLGCYAAGVSGLCRKPAHIAVISPALLVSLEYIRSIILTGFPWELLGHSQYQSLHLIQISDIVGVYGVSFITASVSGVIFLTILHLTEQHWQNESISRKHAASVIAAALLVLAALLGYGGWRIHSYENRKDAEGIRAAAVQGNIDQMIKWKPAFQKATVQKYISLIQTLKDDELIILPETAAPFYFTNEPDLTELFVSAAKNSHAWLLTGSPFFEKYNGDYHFFNSAFLVDPSGVITNRYDKAHLVPFGEYVPLKKWLPFIGKMVEQVGDFKPGPVGAVVPVRNYKMGVLICYEVIFPYLTRSMVQNGAQFLVNITNDAWYGTTSGPYQHFSLAVFRSVETKRPLIRSANTGISGFINAVGRIQQTTPLMQESVISQKITPSTDITIYTRFGDIFAKGCVLFALILIVKKIYRRNTYVRRTKINR